MQTFALVSALVLLAAGALLNTAVLAYFAWRALRVLFSVRPPRMAIVRRTFAPAHR